MTANPPKEGPLKDAVIRICPKCGVVNPAGPSEVCAHLQLARFDGVDEDFALLLADVAAARGRFDEALRTLKAKVLQSLRDRQAELETPRSSKERRSDLPPLPRAKVAPLALESPSQNPRAPAPPPRRTAPAKRSTQSTDPRQLELIVRQPPKGHA
jgi:hypothetical protein